MAEDEGEADHVDRVVVAEMARLESIFSAFDEDSVLSRWRRGTTVDHAEFATVMAAALGWQLESRGAYNPLVGVLSRRWETAVATAVVPSYDEMAELAASIAVPRFEVDGSTVSAIDDCSELNLNALAKGYIVDRAAATAMAAGARSVVVNAGGDLAHRGCGAVHAGIENPRRPYDNEPPLVVVEVANGALATSGSARRGFVVGDQRFGHVVDPGTGWPVESILSISVSAPDAVTADVLATVAGVGSPSSAIDYLDSRVDAEGFVVDPGGAQFCTGGWPGVS